MSSTSSAASAASVSDSNEPECVPSPSAKSTPTAEQFSLDIGQECPSSETSAPLLPTPSATRYGNNRGGGMGRVGPVRPSLDSLTSSAADFPVRTSASPERELVLQAREAGCGLSSLASLAKYDPATRSWRTSQHSVLGGLEPFSETWPRSGMTRSGTAFQLPTLAPLTDETESGSWPIPTVNGNYNRVGLSAQSGDGVATAVTRWPTPHGMCVPNKRRAGPSGNELGRAVNRWPTPNATSDPKTAAGCSQAYIDRRRGTGKEKLSEMVVDGQVGNGSLNPTWVEWLMGFPLGWTVCEAWETRSFRRSRKSSAEQS